VCQDVIPLGPVAKGMDIGRDDDDNPEQLAAGPAPEGEATQAGTARATSSAPEVGLGLQHQEGPDEAQTKAGVATKRRGPEQPQVVEKRKTRSHGSAEELELPASKRSRGKSKSTPSVTRTSENQSAMP